MKNVAAIASITLDGTLLFGGRLDCVPDEQYSREDQPTYRPSNVAKIQPVGESAQNPRVVSYAMYVGKYEKCAYQGEKYY